MGQTFRWLLFDIGNVVIRVTDDGARALAASLGIGVDVLRGYVTKSGLQARAGVGAISPEAYVAAVNARFGASLTVAAVVDALAADVSTPMPGIEAVLRRAGARCRLAAMTDTWFAHWEGVLRTPLAAYFERIIASHQTGLMKTDPRAFLRALETLGATAGEVIFIDDLEVNAASARRAGLTAICAGAAADILAGLKAAGVEL